MDATRYLNYESTCDLPQVVILHEEQCLQVKIIARSDFHIISTPPDGSKVNKLKFRQNGSVFATYL
jgi:hypothetical protein